jgi:hypothetical protein
MDWRPLSVAGLAGGKSLQIGIAVARGPGASTFGGREVFEDIGLLDEGY